MEKCYRGVFDSTEMCYRRRPTAYRRNQTNYLNISNGKYVIENVNPGSIILEVRFETYKTKVVFTICKHKFCIGCSVKSKCCQVCKTNIKEEEKVLY